MSLKNWDNKNWLSSNNYIDALNNFLIKQAQLNKNSNILDIGCSRGKILGSLSSKLKLYNSPIGIDLVTHKDKDKRIIFKKIDALQFFLKNKKRFDLILVKQTIHLLKFVEIKTLLNKMMASLKPKGRILILTLDPFKNEIPTFDLMKVRLKKSLKRDKKILNLITKSYPKRILRKFSFKVNISKKKYTNMIYKRFISTLLKFNNKQIVTGINEINFRYKKNLVFKDKLVCIIIKNN